MTAPSELALLIGDSRFVTPDVNRSAAVVWDNLPPREFVVLDFVGRSAEINELIDWSLDPRRRVAFLCGDGGKGKTAIAYEFASRISAQCPTDVQMVLWFSAKRRKYDVGSRQVQEVANADFSDLPSLLDLLLGHFGDQAGELQILSLEQKKDRLIDYLTQIPCLLILDDLDSLEGEGEDAVGFLLQHIGKTSSRLLGTSRRRIQGFFSASITVIGLPLDDYRLFAVAKSKTFLKGDQLSETQVEQLCKVTDGSPLYTEDFLRFFSLAGEPFHRAIDAWKNRDGSEARLYSLKRELEMLRPHARQVLLALAELREASRAEIEAVVGISKEAVSGALVELDKLFLTEVVRFTTAEPRFAVNLNTGTLVRELGDEIEKNELIRANVHNLRHRSDLPYSSRVASFIRQAIVLRNSNRFREAEETILAAIEKIKSANPDLVGVLGGIYAEWRPCRLEDARDSFKRAFNLGSRKSDLFYKWYRLEKGVGEWGRAIEVASLAIKQRVNTAYFTYERAQCNIMFSRELMSRNLRKPAREKTEQAATDLAAYLQYPESSKKRDQVLRLLDSLRSQLAAR